MNIVTVLWKNGDLLPKRVVDFLRERDTFRNKTLEIVEDFACEAKLLHFFIVHQFFDIFSFCSFVEKKNQFFLYFICSFFHFFFFSFSSFFFILLFFFFSGLLEIRFFLASIASRFLVTFLFKKIVFLFKPSVK